MLNCSGLSLVGLPSDFVPKLMRATSIDSTETSLQLVHLNLSNNRFLVIPAEVAEASTLQGLDMSSNLLGQSHPAELLRHLRRFPPGLSVMNVSKNGLVSEHVNALISVAVASAAAGSAPAARAGRGPSGGAPSGLRSLLCSENRLTELPRRIAELSSSLRELQVGADQQLLYSCQKLNAPYLYVQ